VQHDPFDDAFFHDFGGGGMDPFGGGGGQLAVSLFVGFHTLTSLTSGLHDFFHDACV
jgi:hypothetical protein